MNILNRILVALSLGASAVLTAQTNDTVPERPRGPHRDGPHALGLHRMHVRGGPGFAVVRALDSDRDRELSPAELANAPASLRTLDANADGTVTREELRPLHRGTGPMRPSDAGERPRASRERPAHAPEAGAGWRKRPAEAPAGKPGLSLHRSDRTPRRAVDPVMLALDANQDGALSDAEIANATTSLNALDLDQDGTLTRDELRPLPQEE